MAHSTSTDDTYMQGIPLESMTADAIKSLSKEEFDAALFLTNTQAGASLTMEDVEAALILVTLSASGTDKPATPIQVSDDDSIPKGGQAHKIDSQRQKRRKYLTQHQRQQRANLPKGHQKAEYRNFVAKETEDHRAERLRKKREKYRVKREEAKRLE